MTLRVHPDDIVASRPVGVLAVHPSWPRVRLGDIADVLNGFAFPSSGFGSAGIPLIRIRDVGQAVTDARFSGDYDPAYLVGAGSLLVGMDGDFRVARWEGQRALLNQRVCRITVRNDNFYSKRFLEYVLPGYLDAINRHTSSVTVKHLSSETIKELPLPLPPRAEQARIVAAIEEQFSRIDASVAALRRAHENSRRLRTAAIAVQLSRPNAAQVTIRDIATSIQYGYTAKAVLTRVGPKMLRITDIQDGRVDWDSVPYCSMLDEDSNEYRLAPGDLVFARTGATVGKSFLIRDAPEAVFASYLIRVRFKPLALPEYIALFFQTFEYWRQIAAGRLGTGQPNVNATTLGRITVRLPELDAQHDAVLAMAAIDDQIHTLEVAIDRQAVRAANLRWSILAAAFSGQLVPQDPNDEPASALLERIEADRASRNGDRPARVGTKRRVRVNA